MIQKVRRISWKHEEKRKKRRDRKELERKFRINTADEGPSRIQYKCLVLIYVFPKMRLCGLVISKIEL
jgi:hypothetical protein